MLYSMSHVQQAKAAVAFVRQSICEALSNVLHLNLKNDFNSIISNITTTEAALVRNIFQDHHTPAPIKKYIYTMVNYEQGYILGIFRLITCHMLTAHTEGTPYLEAQYRTCSPETK